MSDQQHPLDQIMDLSDLNLGEISLNDGGIDTDSTELKAEYETSAGIDDVRKMALFSRIPVTLTLEVASVEVSLADLLTVNHDSVIELEKMAGEPLDIKVNGILFGKAEAVVVNEKYGLRILEFNSNDLGELTR